MVKKCGIIMIDHSETYVLLVYGKKSQKWGFPKGHMEFGESEEDTARRELREETGIDWTDKFSYRFRFRNNIYFVVFANREQMNVSLQIEDVNEIEKVGWFTQNQILELCNTDIVNFGLKFWIKRNCPPLHWSLTSSFETDFCHGFTSPNEICL